MHKLQMLKDNKTVDLSWIFFFVAAESISKILLNLPIYKEHPIFYQYPLTVSFFHKKLQL